MRVLICDDDQDSIDLCQGQLIKLADQHKISIEIQTVTSGNELLFYIDSKYSKVDLIYLDIHMPDMNGITIAKKIRARGFHMDIVFYTEDAESQRTLLM